MGLEEGEPRENGSLGWGTEQEGSKGEGLPREGGFRTITFYRKQYVDQSPCTFTTDVLVILPSH
jgi:hypothetical protein